MPFTVKYCAYWAPFAWVALEVVVVPAVELEPWLAPWLEVLETPEVEELFGIGILRGVPQPAASTNAASTNAAMCRCLTARIDSPPPGYLGA